MTVSPDQVRAIAGLARLRLTEAEVVLYATQLSDILAHVADLGEAPEPGTAIDPPIPAAGSVRADVAGADPLLRTPEEFAPGWVAGFFTVPRLIALDGDREGAGQ